MFQHRALLIVQPKCGMKRCATIRLVNRPGTPLYNLWYKPTGQTAVEAVSAADALTPQQRADIRKRILESGVYRKKPYPALKRLNEEDLLQLLKTCPTILFCMQVNTTSSQIALWRSQWQRQFGCMTHFVASRQARAILRGSRFEPIRPLLTGPVLALGMPGKRVPDPQDPSKLIHVPLETENSCTTAHHHPFPLDLLHQVQAQKRLVPLGMLVDGRLLIGPEKIQSVTEEMNRASMRKSFEQLCAQLESLPQTLASLTINSPANALVQLLTRHANSENK